MTFLFDPTKEEIKKTVHFSMRLNDFALEEVK